uniref:L-Fucosyltransferase n=1 Tax=Arion vulgaris TaxID=1028688 RepID=A0A0B6Z6Q3_9EUPU
MEASHQVINRIQVSISSSDELSIVRRTSSNCNMKLRRGLKCYLIAGVTVCFFLLCYVRDWTNLTAYVTNKVPVHRHVVRWADHQHTIDQRRPRIMITYKGRLGNHMFEYASLMGIAQLYNMTPIIPANIDFLDVFKVPTVQGDTSLLRDPVTYTEVKAAAYYPGVEKIDPKRDAYLSGFYQSWRYYQNIRNDLLDKYFILHDSLQKAAETYISNVLKERNMQGAQVVGVHVRRGDFVRQRVKGFTVAPIPYYYRAMAYFRQKYQKVMFIICTNDLVWAETNLDEGNDIHFSHETDGALDLAIMINSNHMIITSGSYSWWAGYLVRGDVIYYLGYPQPNTKIGNQTVQEDYYPPYWRGQW